MEIEEIGIMSNKTLMILAGVLVVLVTGASLLWARDAGKLPTKKTSAMGVDWEQVGNNLSSVEVGKGLGVVNLVKNNEHWQVGEYQADDRLMAELVNGIKSVGGETLVSDNADNQHLYGVASSSGIPVTLGTSTTKLELVVGQNAPSGGVYVRRAESNEVYVVEGLDRDAFGRTVDGWRDKTMVTVAADQVKEVRVTRPDGVMDAIKGDDGKWTMTMGVKSAILDDSTAQRLSAAFGPLTGEGFLNEDEESEFNSAKDKYQVEVISSSGSSTSLSMVERGSEWWVKVGGVGQGYRVAGTIVGDFVLDPEVVFK